jgi:hypothetical protein
VNSLWHSIYRRIPDSVQKGIGVDVYLQRVSVHVPVASTLYSAVFASAATLKLARKSGLRLKANSPQLQFAAGLYADKKLLAAACAAGLQLTHKVVEGAALSGSKLKLQFLHLDHRCRLPHKVSWRAAESGSIDTLVWLRQQGVVFNAYTCEHAAGAGHLHVLVSYLVVFTTESYIRHCSVCHETITAQCELTVAAMLCDVDHSVTCMRLLCRGATQPAQQLRATATCTYCAGCGSRGVLGKQTRSQQQQRTAAAQSCCSTRGSRA